MKAGIAALVAGYLLSQFYRAFLAVLSPVLIAELGVTASQLGHASGLFLLAFALMQLPVGLWLDRIGPRRIAASLLGLGAGGGALVFAFAQGAGAISLAMTLIGAGCAPVLMAAYYIFARSFPAHLFATLGGFMVGAGSIGNLGATLPLAWLTGLFGWRAVLVGLAVITAAVALILLALVRDPPHGAPGTRGSYRQLLTIRDLWPVLPLLALNYSAIGLSGLWIGPFLTDRYGLDQAQVGTAALFIGLAMIAGNFCYGPVDRLMGSRKRPALIGNLACATAMTAIALWPSAPLVPVVVLLMAVLFFGASYALMMAHARAFTPPGIAGRSVGLLNFFSIGGAGAMQYLSGALHAAVPGWTALFLFFALPLFAACLIYTRARDNLA